MAIPNWKWIYQEASTKIGSQLDSIQLCVMRALLLALSLLQRVIVHSDVSTALSNPILVHRVQKTPLLGTRALAITAWSIMSWTC
jgi:hypothetical protein